MAHVRWTLLAVLFVSVACSAGSPESERSEPDGTPLAANAVPSPEASPDPPTRQTVVIDPGHGGEEIGAANYGVVEKESNLDMALRVERLLQDAGIRVVLTRRADVRASDSISEGDGVTFGETRQDLQARVDLANDEGADLFLSIHSNGSTDASQRGIEVYHDPNRPFAAASERFASIALSEVLRSLIDSGVSVLNRGIKSSDCIRVRDGQCFPLFVLGPPRTITRQQLLNRGLDPAALGMPAGRESVTSRATEMPGILVELMFISNGEDAAILREEAARDAMARGIAQAVLLTLGEAED